VETVAGESQVAPGVTVLPAPGHTPGHLAVLVSSEGEQLLDMGDAAAHPAHLEAPYWQNGFDLKPLDACLTRRSLLERAAGANMHVMAFHFPFPSVGRISKLPSGGWEWTPGW
jgi:glyoxylase-like metal-dependent hydrolase (beta-lactamase superfamily II)